MIYYMIRHKATQKFMPLMRRGKGYSHWNPGNPEAVKITAETTIPRLLRDEKHAKRVVALWFSQPNAYNKPSCGHYGDEDGWDVEFKPDGRKKEDLEVVMVSITELFGLEKR